MKQPCLRSPTKRGLADLITYVMFSMVEIFFKITFLDGENDTDQIDVFAVQNFLS